MKSSTIVICTNPSEKVVADLLREELKKSAYQPKDGESESAFTKRITKQIEQVVETNKEN